MEKITKNNTEGAPKNRNEALYAYRKYQETKKQTDLQERTEEVLMFSFRPLIPLKQEMKKQPFRPQLHQRKQKKGSVQEDQSQSKEKGQKVQLLLSSHV